MADNIPSAGPATAASAIANAGDLTASQQSMCDDLIIKLNQALGVPAAATTAALASNRAGLWALVFENGCDTNRPIKHPGALSYRRGLDIKSATEVGTWTTDLQAPSTPSKRKQSGEAVVKAAPQKSRGPGLYQAQSNL